jgi:hypothetical protein
MGVGHQWLSPWQRSVQRLQSGLDWLGHGLVLARYNMYVNDIFRLIQNHFLSQTFVATG